MFYSSVELPVNAGRATLQVVIAMVLHIRDPEADRLTRELAARTGQPITRVVVEALRDKLKREQARTAFPRLKDEIMAISRRSAALPRRTGRTVDEILDYDERGLPR
jgi:antitoxin VapB